MNRKLLIVLGLIILIFVAVPAVMLGSLDPMLILQWNVNLGWRILGLFVGAGIWIVSIPLIAENLILFTAIITTVIMVPLTWAIARGWITFEMGKNIISRPTPKIVEAPKPVPDETLRKLVDQAEQK